jgi:hypothetical protein
MGRPLRPARAKAERIAPSRLRTQNLTDAYTASSGGEFVRIASAHQPARHR